MDIVFDDDNARVLRSVHDELISAVEDDVVAVARIECHQGVTTTNCLGPSGEMISKLEHCVVGNGIEIWSLFSLGLRNIKTYVEPKDDCPAMGFVNPMLMLSPVKKYVPAVRISQKPSRRSPKANQVLTVDRAGEVSI